MNASDIRQRVLDLLPDDDDDDVPEYVELMRSLAAEFSDRADTAEKAHGWRTVLRTVQDWCATHQPDERLTAELWQTGGGCTAIGVQPKDASYQWLITESGGARAPSTASEPLSLGFYLDNGSDGRLCFRASDLAAALAIIGSYEAHSL